MALELHLQRLAVIPPPAAHVARDIHVRQEVHFDAFETVALARLAAASLHVEAETPRLVAPLARFRQHGVEIAYGREEAGVGGRIRARRAADGRLVDADYLVDIRDSVNAIVRAGFLVRAVDFLGQRAV